MTDQTRSDIDALLDAFTPEQLAMFMARRLHYERSSGALETIPAEYLEPESSRFPALIVAPVRPRYAHEGDTGPDGYTITVREKTRATGYYIVFESQYARDVVAFWNDETGRWQTTHLDGTETLAGSNYTNPRPLPGPWFVEPNFAERETDD